MVISAEYIHLKTIMWTIDYYIWFALPYVLRNYYLVQKISHYDSLT